AEIADLLADSGTHAGEFADGAAHGLHQHLGLLARVASEFGRLARRLAGSHRDFADQRTHGGTQLVDAADALGRGDADLFGLRAQRLVYLLHAVEGVGRGRGNRVGVRLPVGAGRGEALTGIAD